MIAPDVFTVTGEGFVRLLTEFVADDARERATAGVNACPVGALSASAD